LGRDRTSRSGFQIAMGYLPGTRIEIVHSGVPVGHIRYALFDFDGTLSLIRAGWQDIMTSMMVEILKGTPKGQDKSQEEIKTLVTDFVTVLTGKQTIYQMIRLGKEVKCRGGKRLDPIEYKRIYHKRLWGSIKGRYEALQAGRVNPDELMIPGSRGVLEALQNRGILCYLASGTDEVYVLDEARSLQVDQYFSGIYGALDNWKLFSKRMVIERIIEEHHLQGEEFVSFGDGFVEVEETKSVGGTAVGVASNEITRKGMNEWKRERLIEAGADVVISDFREHARLVDFLTGDTLESLQRTNGP